MASKKLVLMLSICIFSLFLLSPITAIDDERASPNNGEKLQATSTPLGKILLTYLSKVENIEVILV